jgi:hypothetical protein
LLFVFMIREDKYPDHFTEKTLVYLWISAATFAKD